MFWKKKKPSLEGQERYLNEEGDPHNAWDSVKEIEYLLSSPYVKLSLLESELYHKSAYLLLALRENEKWARGLAELNGGIDACLEKAECQLAAVNEALWDLSALDYRIDANALQAPRLIEGKIRALFDEKW